VGCCLYVSSRRSRTEKIDAGAAALVPLLGKNYAMLCRNGGISLEKPKKSKAGLYVGTRNHADACFHTWPQSLKCQKETANKEEQKQGQSWRRIPNYLIAE